LSETRKNSGPQAPPTLVPAGNAASSPALPTEKPRREKLNLKKFRLDIALGLGAVGCLAFFFWNSTNFEKRTGIGQPVATLTAGNVERKANGNMSFVLATPGSQFFNMDVAWVGKGGSADLTLDDGVSVHLDENTLIILKRPFKRKLHQTVRERVKVIRGKVTTSSAAEREIQNETVFKELPAPKPSASGGPGGPGQAVQPRPGVTLYFRAAGLPIAIFAWPQFTDGVFVVLNKTTQQANYMPITHQNTVRYELPHADGSFAWQLIDAKKNVLLGPFSFQTKFVDDAKIGELLRHPPPKGTAEIYF
jgi:hypothetical protein